jgi:hypothetical protein
MPYFGARRRRVVFERRTQQQNSTARATSPLPLNQRDEYSMRIPPPPDEADEPSKTTAQMSAEPASTASPLQPDPGVSIDLPPPSAIDSAPVDPAAAEYLFPTPPRSPSSAQMSQDPAATAASNGVPEYFCREPLLKPEEASKTQRLQDETVEECLPGLTGQLTDENGPYNAACLPRLKREEHAEFLREGLEEYPTGWTALDASRPWAVYWAFTGLSTLGEDISEYEDRYVLLRLPTVTAIKIGAGHDIYVAVLVPGHRGLELICFLSEPRNSTVLLCCA